MDLSGLIFVALAVAWAGYLIPRALRQSDELDLAAPVDTSSDTARVLHRTPAMMRQLLADSPPLDPERKAADRVALRRSERQRHAAYVRVRPVSRGAALRRRRILLVLAAVTGLSAVLAGLSVVGWWSVVTSAVLVVGWLALCVLMARRARVSARRSRVAVPPARDAEVPDAEVPAVPASPIVQALVAEAHADAESIAPLSDEPATAVPEPALDAAEGALWDPLPLSLPTYVGKPAARRTVRTIELTRTGVTSSGHDAADSALARRAAEEARRATVADAPAPQEGQRAIELGRRRAAGA